MSIVKFIRESRVRFSLAPDQKELRVVSVSHILKENEGQKLADLIADRAPFYYRDFNKIVDSMKDGYLLTVIRETLQKLPTSEHFQSSHFGEITSSIFVEDVLGLKRIYCKLSLNSTENQHGYKMDLITYKPGTNPVEFVFCEVKSSPKDSEDGLPPGHDKSCYADIFNSLRNYEVSDKQFDLTSIKDQLQNITDDQERNMLRESLKPYSDKLVGYVGIAIIDHSTYDQDEVPILATRKAGKSFDVELLSVESYKQVSRDVFSILKKYI